MTERGWGWTASKIRQTQLTVWIASQLPGSGLVAAQDFSVASFYAALPDQSVNNREVVVSDLEALKRARLINFQAPFGGIEHIHVQATQGGRDQAEAWRQVRTNPRLRKQACRDALVSWLHGEDSSELHLPVVERMLTDPRHGLFFAEPFSGTDVDEASAWLERNGLVKGPKVDGRLGPVRAYLLDAGITCAEDFDADTDNYMKAQKNTPGSAHTIYISGDNHGQVAAGDNAHQVQNISRPEDLRLLTAGIAEIVRAFAPDYADESAKEAEAAQAAITARGVDVPALERFRDWAVGALRTGASNAVVAAVSSSTTFLIIEAGRLAAHIL